MKDNKDTFFLRARDNMVFNQLVPSGLVDKNIIDAILNSPRHRFINSRYRELAYTDAILPIQDTEIFIDDNRFIMPPEVFAKVLQASGISRESKVLDFNCGTGFSTAVIAKIAQKVYATDVNQQFLSFILKEISKLDLAHKIYLKTFKDFKEDNQKFDLLFTNGILSHIPFFLSNKIKETGKMLTIEKGLYTYQCVQYTKIKSNLVREELFPINVDERLNVEL